MPIAAAAMTPLAAMGVSVRRALRATWQLRRMSATAMAWVVLATDRRVATDDRFESELRLVRGRRSRPVLRQRLVLHDRRRLGRHQFRQRTALEFRSGPALWLVHAANVCRNRL